MDAKRSSKKILVAVSSKDLLVITDALGFEFTAVVCHSFKEAEIKLTENIAMILCGLCFDGGMMFELLRHAKASPKTRHIPFYSVVESKNIFSLQVLSSIQMAGKILGADGFIHLFDVPNKAGEPKVYENLRKLIRQTV